MDFDEFDLILFVLLTIQASIGIISFIFYRKVKSLMAVADNLNVAVSALDSAAGVLVAAVEAFVAAAGVNDDVAVQAAVDKINAISAALNAEAAKVSAPKA